LKLRKRMEVEGGLVMRPSIPCRRCISGCPTVEL
jgi:hypothetical protein